MKFNFHTCILRGILAISLIGFALQLQAQTPFYSEDFSDSLRFVNQWRSGGSNSGPERWRWSRNANGIFQGQPTFGAKTATNGHIVFNSDVNGENAHDVHITSPAINCSGQNNVFLRFENQYGYFSQPEQSIAEVGVSTDSLNFTYYRVLTNVARNDVAQPLQVQTLELPTAANQPKVFIRFRWRGIYEYAWRIDDITLTNANPAPNFDLALSTPLISLNFAEPVSQVDTMFTIVAMENKGLQNQNNIALKVDVRSTNGQTASKTEDILGQAAGRRDTFLLDELFVPRDTGIYTFTITASSANQDQDTTNNKLTETYLVTQNLFSKDDGRIVSATQPGEIRGDLWEIGNFYEIIKGGFEAYEAIFSVASNNNAHQGKSVSLLLYKIKENNDNTFDDQDLEIVGYGFHEFKTEANFAVVTTPLLSLATNEQGVRLDADESYILTVQYSPEMFVPYSIKPYAYNAISTVVKNGQWFLGGFGDAVTALMRMRIRPVMVTSVKEPQLAESRLNIFPNPATRDLRVDLELEQVSDLVELRMMDATGRTILTQQYDRIQNGAFNFDVSNFPNGAYLLQVRTAEGVRTKRFLIQR